MFWRVLWISRWKIDNKVDLPSVTNTKQGPYLTNSAKLCSSIHCGNKLIVLPIPVEEVPFESSRKNQQVLRVGRKSHAGKRMEADTATCEYLFLTVPLFCLLIDSDDTLFSALCHSQIALIGRKCQSLYVLWPLFVWFCSTCGITFGYKKFLFMYIWHVISKIADLLDLYKHEEAKFRHKVIK